MVLWRELRVVVIKGVRFTNRPSATLFLLTGYFRGYNFTVFCEVLLGLIYVQFLSALFLRQFLRVTLSFRDAM